MPRAIIGASLLVIALYLLVNVGYFFALAPVTIAGLPEDASVAGAVLARLLGGGGASLLIVAMMISTAGGVHYTYAVAGAGSPGPHSASAAEQTAALDALFVTLSPDVLTVSPQMAMLLSSGVNGRDDLQFDSEVFATAGAAVFDPLVATDVAAQLTLDTLLAPSRLTRVYLQHAADPALPGLDDLLGRLADVIDRRQTAVERRISHRAILAMAKAQRDPRTSIDVAAMLDMRLHSVATRLVAAKGEGIDAAWSRNMAAMLRDDDALGREIGKGARAVPQTPPGMPIG